MFYFLLYLFYTIIPPTALYFCLRKIYKEKDKYGWHLLYFAKLLITLSFLPLLYFSNVDLALTPKSSISIFFLLLTVCLATLGIGPAIKKGVLHFYFGGVYAAFMEEILFRGILFGLALVIWQSNLTAIIVSSMSFGLWHLKNYGWHQDKKWVALQFFYTAFIYGPIFSLMRIYTGDLYLAVLFHFITDVYVALAPKSWRWTITGDLQKGNGFRDI